MERGASWWQDLRARWKVQTVYQRFEMLVALVLTVLVGLVILVALLRLSASYWVAYCCKPGTRSTIAYSRPCSATF